jgi:hypothetical protein
MTYLTDLDTVLNMTGNCERVVFPQFHEDTLYRSLGKFEEPLGRITVVISEGLHTTQPRSEYTRVRNVVSFSFQHVPLGIVPHL